VGNHNNQPRHICWGQGATGANRQPFSSATVSKVSAPHVEAHIVKLHVREPLDSDSLESAIALANKLRERAEVGDIPYSPTIRETIAFARLLSQRMSPVAAATVVFANAYQQWGEIEAQKVNDLIVSLFGVTKSTGE
jgi:hypothetical protein